MSNASLPLTQPLADSRLQRLVPLIARTEQRNEFTAGSKVIRQPGDHATDDELTVDPAIGESPGRGGGNVVWRVAANALEGAPRHGFVEAARTACALSMPFSRRLNSA